MQTLAVILFQIFVSDIVIIVAVVVMYNAPFFFIFDCLLSCIMPLFLIFDCLLIFILILLLLLCVLFLLL